MCVWICINHNPSFYHCELVLPGLSLFSKVTIQFYIFMSNARELQWFHPIIPAPSVEKYYFFLIELSWHFFQNQSNRCVGGSIYGHYTIFHFFYIFALLAKQHCLKYYSFKISLEIRL